LVLQEIASNYVGGFIILLDRSIRMGDLLTVENRHGTVKGIHSRYTVLKSLDGTEAIIPNDYSDYHHRG
jgi:small-conductance mechanosensitive channel